MNYKSKSLLAAERIIRELKEQDGNIKIPIDPFKILKSKNVRITFSAFDKALVISFWLTPILKLPVINLVKTKRS